MLYKSKTIWPLATHRGRLAPQKRPKKVAICNTTEVPDNLPESDEQAFLKNAEIEGIKIYTVNGTDYMFIMFREQGSSKRARIFSYPVSSNN